MATLPTTPGVYIKEVRKFPPSIAQVETAIPAFIGYTERAKKKIAGDRLRKPTRIQSMVEYEEIFGFADKEQEITVTFSGGTGGVPEAATADLGQRRNYLMYYALQFYFSNGGGPCYIVSVGTYNADSDILQPNDLLAGLAEVEKEDEVTLIVFPEGQNIPTIDDYINLQVQSLAQCEKLKDRFAVMDIYPANSDDGTDVEVFRDKIGTENLKYGAAYYPNLETIFDFNFDEAQVTIVNGAAETLAALKTENNAQYAKALLEINTMANILPPTPAIVGIYAKVDEQRGVWKAPANVNVNSVIKPVIKISDDEQSSLNVDVNAGKSVNAIRSFAGRGAAIVWGARTLAGNDNEWRYIPVRRFFNMVEESAKKATAPFVFEPNDPNTWTKVKSMIENFLILQWRAGALFGSTPDQAFYVAVGLNETMTALDILEGRMIVEIGMAVNRPAEFIILTFSHKMPEA